MQKISKVTIAKIASGYCLLSLEESEARLAELYYGKVKELPTRQGLWRFYLRQSHSQPEFLAERGIKPADSVVALYIEKPAGVHYGYLLMSSGKSIHSLEDAVQNATVLTQDWLERKSLLDRTALFFLAAGAVTPVGIAEAVNYLLGSPMGVEPRIPVDIAAFMLGGIGTYGGLYYGFKLVRNRLIAKFAAQMSNPDDYVYGKDSINLLAKESRQFRDARAEEGVYLSAGVQIGRQAFHEQLEGLIKTHLRG